MLYIIGKPNTGKSVMFKVLTQLVPKGWHSSIALEQFGDPNSLVQMATAYFNVANEAGRRSKDVDDVLLRVTVGEPVAIKLLYANKLQAVLPTRLIFQGNLVPDTTDATGAIQRRILMIRTTDVQPEKSIPFFERLLLKERAGILAKFARAYKRMVERGHIEEPSYGRAIVERSRLESNSAILWMEESCDLVNDIEDGMHNQELFDHYLEWCARTNMYKLSIVLWGKALASVDVPTIRARLPSGKVYKRMIKLKTNIRSDANRSY